jgi:peptide chain release factor 2
MREIETARREIENHRAFARRIDDARALADLADEAGDASAAREAAGEAARLKGDLEAALVAASLTGPHDRRDAFLSVHAGAGGTESCDWAEMLLRMYTRWAEAKGYTVEALEMERGEEAGIRSATVRLGGPHAYGLLRGETGVHRLVRISPFDAAARRHTSFAAVEAMPDLPDDAEVEVRDEDLRIDTFRAGGHGGQNVNKVESAVRVVHVPTGVIVTCQTERSQHKNRANAMRLLRARLYERREEERRAETERLRGEKGEIAWGRQIRSYVLQPYRMVKDHRTNFETSDSDAVLDGAIDPFLEAFHAAAVAARPARG